MLSRSSVTQSGVFKRSQCLAIGQGNRSIEALIPGHVPATLLASADKVIE
jgi:hypothetical protein